MDCSKTEVFLKEWERMCKMVGCSMCEISKKGRGCKIFLMYEPAEAIKIVQEWSDSHPIKTRLSVLKEHYPNARIALNGAPYACVKNLYDWVIECPSIKKRGYISDEDCLQCWNTPIEGDANV